MYAGEIWQTFKTGFNIPEYHAVFLMLPLFTFVCLLDYIFSLYPISMIFLHCIYCADQPMKGTL